MYVCIIYMYIYIYVEQKVSPKHARATLLSLADERCLAFTGRPKGPDRLENATDMTHVTLLDLCK